jgi:hypothetical protein
VIFHKPVIGLALVSPQDRSHRPPVERSCLSVCVRVVEVAWDDGAHDEQQGTNELTRLRVLIDVADRRLSVAKRHGADRRWARRGGFIKNGSRFLKPVRSNSTPRPHAPGPPRTEGRPVSRPRRRARPALAEGQRCGLTSALVSERGSLDN